MPGEHKAALNPTLDCATSLRPMLGCGAGLRPAQGSGTVSPPRRAAVQACVPCWAAARDYVPRRAAVRFCTPRRAAVQAVPCWAVIRACTPCCAAARCRVLRQGPRGAQRLRGSKCCRLSAGFALCAGQVYRSAPHDDVSQRPRFMVSSVFIAPCMRHGISNASISLRPQPYGLAFSKQYKRTCVRFTVLRTIAHASLILPGAAW